MSKILVRKLDDVVMYSFDNSDEIIMLHNRVKTPEYDIADHNEKTSDLIENVTLPVDYEPFIYLYQEGSFISI